MTKSSALRIVAFLFVLLGLVAISTFAEPPNKNKTDKNVVLIKEVTIPAAAAGQIQATHSVKLTWADTVNPTGTTYNVYKASGGCPASGIPTGASKLNATPVTVLTFTDSGITVAGSFCYYVTAVGSGGESAASNTASAVIPAPPAAPTNLVITVTSP